MLGSKAVNIQVLFQEYRVGIIVYYRVLVGIVCYECIGVFVGFGL